MEFHAGSRILSIYFPGRVLERSLTQLLSKAKVDVILSARPQDRRAIFDEASGITRYRARKREAERKLVEVRADQLRVGRPGCGARQAIACSSYSGRRG